jgi:hypothetical protein
MYSAKKIKIKEKSNKLQHNKQKITKIESFIKKNFSLKKINTLAQYNAEATNILHKVRFETKTNRSKRI